MMMTSNREQKVQQIITVLSNMSTSDIVNGILKQPDGPRRLREYMDFDARCGAVLRQKLRLSMADLACQENTCFFVRHLINTSDSREEAIELCKQLNPPEPQPIISFVTEDGADSINNNVFESHHDPFNGPTLLLQHHHHHQYQQQQQFQQQQQQQQQQSQSRNFQNQNQHRHFFPTNEVGVQMELLTATRELVEFIISEVDADVLAPLIFSKAVDLINGHPDARGPLVLFIEKCSDQERLIRGTLLEKVLSPHFPTLMTSYNGSRFLIRHIMIRRESATTTSAVNNMDSTTSYEMNHQDENSSNSKPTSNTNNHSNNHRGGDGRQIWMMPLWVGNNGIKSNFESICRTRAGSEFVLEFLKRATLEFFDNEVVPFFVKEIMASSSASSSNDKNNCDGDADENDDSAHENTNNTNSGTSRGGDETIKNFFVHDPLGRPILEKIAATISDFNRGGWLKKLIQALSTPSAFVNKAEKMVRLLEEKLQRGEANKKKNMMTNSSNNASMMMTMSKNNSREFSASGSSLSAPPVSHHNNISREFSTSNNSNHFSPLVASPTINMTMDDVFVQNTTNEALNFPASSSSSSSAPAATPVAAFEKFLVDVFAHPSPKWYLNNVMNSPQQVEAFFNAAVSAARHLQERFLQAKMEEQEKLKQKQQQLQQLQMAAAMAGRPLPASIQHEITNLANFTTNVNPSSFLLLSSSTSPTIKKLLLSTDRHASSSSSSQHQSLTEFVLGMLTSPSFVNFGFFPKLLRQVYGEIQQNQPPPLWIPLSFSVIGERNRGDDPSTLSLIPRILTIFQQQNAAVPQQQIVSLLSNFQESILALIQSTIVNPKFHSPNYLRAQLLLTGEKIGNNNENKEHHHPTAVNAMNSSALRYKFVENIISSLFRFVFLDENDNNNTMTTTKRHHHDQQSYNSNNISITKIHSTCAELIVKIATLLVSERNKETERMIVSLKNKINSNSKNATSSSSSSASPKSNEENSQENVFVPVIITLNNNNNNNNTDGGRNNSKNHHHQSSSRAMSSTSPTLLGFITTVYSCLLMNWGLRSNPQHQQTRDGEFYFSSSPLRKLFENFVLFLNPNSSNNNSNNYGPSPQQQQHQWSLYFALFVDELLIPLIKTIPLDNHFLGQFVHPISKMIFAVAYCRLRWMPPPTTTITTSSNHLQDNNYHRPVPAKSSSSSSSALATIFSPTDSGQKTQNQNNEIINFEEMYSSFSQENVYDDKKNGDGDQRREKRDSSTTSATNNNNVNNCSNFYYGGCDDDDYFFQGTIDTTDSTTAPTAQNTSSASAISIEDFFDQKSTIRAGEIAQARISGFDFLRAKGGCQYLTASTNHNNSNNNKGFDINAAVAVTSLRGREKNAPSSSSPTAMDPKRFLSVPFEHNRQFLMSPVILFNFIPKFIPILAIDVIVEVVFTAILPLLLVLRDEQQHHNQLSTRSDYKTLKHVLFSSLQKVDGRVNIFEHLTKHFGIDLENFEASDLVAGGGGGGGEEIHGDEQAGKSHHRHHQANATTSTGFTPAVTPSISSSLSSSCISYPPPLLFDEQFGFPITYYPSSPILMPPPFIIINQSNNNTDSSRRRGRD